MSKVRHTYVVEYDRKDEPEVSVSLRLPKGGRLVAASFTDEMDRLDRVRREMGRDWQTAEAAGGEG